MTVLKIKQGATYSFGFTWRSVELDVNGEPVKDGNGEYVLGDPISLTGCLVRMQIRRKIGEPVLVSATSEEPGDPLDPALVEAGAGRIRLQTPDKNGTLRPGHVQVTLTDLDTMKLTVKAAVFDLEVVWPLQPGDIRPRVDRPLEGTVEVTLNVTVD